MGDNEVARNAIKAVGNVRGEDATQAHISTDLDGLEAVKCFLSCQSPALLFGPRFDGMSHAGSQIQCQ